jgi:two-component system chemotaxis response regulator CheY
VAFNTKIKILVVDDMQTMRKVLKNMLIKLGCDDVHEAADGIPAWEMIQDAHKGGEPFKFVLSDWNMPGMTGLELLKNVRSRDEFKRLPFLMITAEGEQNNVLTAVRAGVSNFVVKPFSIGVLQDKINKIFP